MLRTFTGRLSTMHARLTPEIRARDKPRSVLGIAWTAVKRSYVKIGNNWMARQGDG
jgi:hypothetical protein